MKSVRLARERACCRYKILAEEEPAHTCSLLNLPIMTKSWVFLTDTLQHLLVLLNLGNKLHPIYIWQVTICSSLRANIIKQKVDREWPRFQTIRKCQSFACLNDMRFSHDRKVLEVVAGIYRYLWVTCTVYLQQFPYFRFQSPYKR